MAMKTWNTRWPELLKERIVRRAESLGVNPSKWLRSIAERELDRKDERRKAKR